MANDENIIPYQFTSEQNREEAAKNGRKGGIKSGIARRKKFASRKFLKEVLAMKVQKTAELERVMRKFGMDPERDLTVEDLGALALLKKFTSADLRAYDMVYEYLEEDPHTLLEEKRLKTQEGLAKAIVNRDGFLEAMGASVEEVFEDGCDTPDTLEDTD